MKTATAATSAADRQVADNRQQAGRRLRELAANLDVHRGFAEVIASLEAGHGGTLGGVWGSSRALVAAAWRDRVRGRSLLLPRIRARSGRLPVIWRCLVTCLLRSFPRGKRSRASESFTTRFMGSDYVC